MTTERFIQYPIPVHRTVLDSGLTILTADTQSGLCHVRLCLNAGGRRDGERPGLAHFTEHVVARGNAKEGNNPRYDSLRRLGVSLNAMTSYSTTSYSVTALVSEMEDLVKALILNVLVDDTCTDYVEEERMTIMQEVRDRLPNDHFMLWSHKEWYPTHPEVHHPLGGMLEDVGNITAEDIRRFVGRYYCLANAVLIVTGGVQHSDIIRLVSTLNLSSVPSGDRNDYQVPDLALHRVDYAGDRRSPGVTLRFLAPEYNTDDGLVVVACMNVLTHGLDSMLLHRLRQREGLAYAVLGNRDLSFTQEFSLECLTQAQHFDRAERAMFEELSRLMQGDVPQHLFKRVKATMIRSYVGVAEDHGSKGSFSGWANTLMNNWSLKDFRFRTDQPEFYRTLELEDLAEVASRVFAPHKIGVTHSTYAPVAR